MTHCTSPINTVAASPQSALVRFTRDADGIWVVGGASPVSYPPGGYEDCFRIEEGSFWFRHRNACIVDLARRFHSGGAFVDVGGGNGAVSRALQDAGIETILVEPGITGARNARRRGVKTVVCGRVEDVGIEPASLEAIGIFDVLEHIEPHTQFLHSLRSLLRPDGMLYLTVPAYQWLWSLEDVQAGHCRRYSLRQLKRVLRDSGFAPVFGSYIFSFLPLPVLFFRALPYRLGSTHVRAPDDHAREHGTKGGAITAMIDRVLDFERAALRHRVAIPFGGSCLVVARRDG